MELWLIELLIIDELQSNLWVNPKTKRYMCCAKFLEEVIVDSTIKERYLCIAADQAAKLAKMNEN